MVKITEILKEQHINLNIEAREKPEAISELLELVDDSQATKDREALYQCLMEREELETTGIGDGIGLPHGRTDDVSELTILFGYSARGIEFQALDGRPVHVIFLILAPKKSSTKLLQTLAKISRLVNNKDFRKCIGISKTPAALIELIRSKE
ncbi:MAG: PTS sugar transporter subunit IIA [bacterium]